MLTAHLPFMHGYALLGPTTPALCAQVAFGLQLHGYLPRFSSLLLERATNQLVARAQQISFLDQILKSLINCNKKTHQNNRTHIQEQLNIYPTGRYKDDKSKQSNNRQKNVPWWEVNN